MKIGEIYFRSLQILKNTSKVKKKILIFGDSFAEPCFINNKEVDNWVRQAFDSDLVENNASGGSSFWRIFDNLHHFEEWRKIKHCIVFWSEHMRIYVRSANKFVGGNDEIFFKSDVTPWNIKTKQKHIFGKPINKVRLVQKNVQQSCELGITEREFENLKAYSCLQYMYNVFYKKYPKVNFINIHCFPWLSELTGNFGIDVNFKSSVNVIHVNGYMTEHFSNLDKKYNHENHMTGEQHTKFAKFISQITNRLEDGGKITRNPDLRKI